MLGNWKITPRQFKLLVFLCYVGTAVLASPGFLAAQAKQDGWIGAIIGLIGGLLIVQLYNLLGNLTPNLTITQQCEKFFGKWLGKVVSLLFISFLFINSSMILWISGNFVTTQIMPETPIQFTNILFTLIIVMAARLGIETIARTAEILFPVVFGLLVILILFVSPNIDIKNIQPVFEFGMKPILGGSLLYISYASFTLIVMLMIFPANVNNIKESNKAFLSGTLLGGIMIFLIVLFSILVLGHDFAMRNEFPSYVLAKKIQLGGFIERIESLIAIIWFITVFYKTLLYFYGAVLGLAQTLELKDYRPLTLPMGMILVVLSLIVFPNTIYAAKWDSRTWVSYSLTYCLLLPLLLLLVGILRKKKKGE